jgi:hypothetical protein
MILLLALASLSAHSDELLRSAAQSRDAELIVLDAPYELAGDTPTLFVVPCPRDPVQVEFQRVQALVRASHWPVLLV